MHEHTAHPDREGAPRENAGTFMSQSGKRANTKTESRSTLVAVCVVANVVAVQTRFRLSGGADAQPCTFSINNRHAARRRGKTKTDQEHALETPLRQQYCFCDRYSVSGPLLRYVGTEICWSDLFLDPQTNLYKYSPFCFFSCTTHGLSALHLSLLSILSV